MNSRRLRLPHLTFLLIYALFPTTSGAQECENGTYPNETKSTTGETTESSAGSRCIPCNLTVPFCSICRISENSTNPEKVDCIQCFDGYHVTDKGRNCSNSSGVHPPEDENRVVGIVVGVVVGVVVVVGLVILVVCLVRSERCSATAFRSTTPPPPYLPDPDHLASSYKDNQQSGTGQGRDHRYAKEPGPTSPRVESVQYDGVKVGFGNESSPYVNCTDVTSTANAKLRKTKADDREKEKEEEKEEEEDDDVYVNSPSTQQAPSSRRSKPSPSPSGPGPTKPKPSRKQKEEDDGAKGHLKTVAEKRDSVFPPDDSPEQVYCNEPDSDNEEDYVNADVTHMRASR